MKNKKQKVKPRKKRTNKKSSVVKMTEEQWHWYDYGVRDSLENFLSEIDRLIKENESPFEAIKQSLVFALRVYPTPTAKQIKRFGEKEKYPKPEKK